jgi:hypothetical protein
VLSADAELLTCVVAAQLSTSFAIMASCVTTVDSGREQYPHVAYVNSSRQSHVPTSQALIGGSSKDVAQQ